MQRTIVEERSKNIVIMDVFSKLAQERIVFIDDVIDDELANGVIAQLLYLDSINNKQINVYINSPGGNILAGLAIYDISKLIKSPIRTVCVGAACSMAGVLMLMGAERCGLKHSRVMIHQLKGGVFGKPGDVKVVMEQMDILEKELFDIIVEKTNIKNPFTACDIWYTAKEALEAGILTSIL